MSFKPIQKLNVQRTLATGEMVSVGVLAQNRQGVFFQYNEEYINKFRNLSPFTLQNNGLLQQAPKDPQLDPFYDVTYSPHPFNEHATAFAGHGKAPPLKVMQKLAASAGFANWREAQQCIQEVVEAIANFSSLATQQAISKATVQAITETLAQRKQENAVLLF